MNKIYKILEVYRTRHFRKVQNDYESKYLSLKVFPDLTDDEVAQINDVWPWGKLRKDDLTWHRIYKAFNGFSPYVLGLYQSCVFRSKVNPKNQLQALENKGLCDVYFPSIPFPHTLVRKIHNVYFDSNMNVISKMDIDTLLASTKEFIIKPSVDTEQGVGVRKIKNSGCSLMDTISKYQGDFVIQDVLRQHPELSSFSPLCINTCRITSVFIKGSYDYSIMLKIGKEGAFKDNWNCSYLIGAGKDGMLNDWGLDYNLNIVKKSDNGKLFEGFKIPYIEKMLCFVENCHKRYFPNCGIIGWDITVDAEGEIEVIETNLTGPGIVAEQLVSGPFMKNFIINYNE